MDINQIALIETKKTGGNELKGDKAQGGKEGSTVSCVGDTGVIATNSVEGMADMVSNSGVWRSTVQPTKTR